MRELNKDIENIVPIIVANRGSFLARVSIKGELRGSTREEINHPDISVPSASRLSDFVSLEFSSLEGIKVLNVAFSMKQK